MHTTQRLTYKAPSPTLPTHTEGIRQGLDFEQALADPDLPDLVTSPQMLIQLRRFNQTAQQALAGRGAALSAAAQRQQRAAAAAPRGGGLGKMEAALGPRAVLQQDPLGKVIGTPTSDSAGVDTSVAAVVKRLLLLLLALTGLGVGLFFLGLETVLKVD